MLREGNKCLSARSTVKFHCKERFYIEGPNHRLNSNPAYACWINLSYQIGQFQYEVTDITWRKYKV